MTKLQRSLGVNLLATFALSLSGARAAAATINVPADLPTIQQAISAASNGDTILVAPGTYHENINFLGKAITVESSGGPSVTTIDGGGTESVVTFDSGESNNSELEGFTITNGNASADNSYNGGGIAIQHSSPTIRNNVISKNAACTGGGVGLSGSPNAVIKDNIITENSPGTCEGATGGGISIYGGGVVQIIGNMISKNTGGTGGGIYLNAAGAPTIKDNTIAGNIGADGGGIATVNQTQGAIVQNLIIANIAGPPSDPNNGGGINLSVPNGSIGPMSINNTIVGKQAREGSGVYASGFDSQTALYNNLVVGSAGPSAFYCDGSYGYAPQVLYNNDAFSPSGKGFGGACSGIAGTNGNISADPLLLDETSNFHLQPGSPAAGTGDSSAPDLPLSDLDGNPRLVNGAINMGVYELRQQDTSPPDFSIAVPPGDSASATVTPGGMATYSLTVAPEDGFGQTVSLACSGAPSLAVCTVSPSSVTLDGTNSQTVTVTVTTTAASALLPPSRARPISGGGNLCAVWLGLAATFGLAMWLRHRTANGRSTESAEVKRHVLARVRSATLFAILFGVAAFAACGGGGSGAGGNSTTPVSSPGTPTGTYTLTLTGTSGSLTHSATLTLTVN